MTKNASYLRLYLKSLSYVWHSSKTYVTLMFLIIPLQSLMPSFTIYFTNRLIEDLSNSESNSIYQLLFIWGTTFFISSITTPLLTAIQGKLTDFLTFKLNFDIMKKSQSLQTIDYFEDANFYNDIQILSSESNWRPVNLLIFGSSIISNSILFISMIILFFNFHPLIALLMIVSSLPQGFISYKIQQQSFETLVSNSEDSRHLDYYSQVLLSSNTIKDVRLFNLFDFFLTKYKEVFNRIQNSKQKNRNKKLFLASSFLTITTIINIISFIYIILKIKDGNLGVGSIMVFSTSLIYSSNAVTRLVEDSSMLYDTLLYMEKFFIFTNITSPNKKKNLSTFGSNTIEAIEFKNVSFSYKNSTKLVLNNISFKIKKGEKVAIVGENGAGKTTLVKLLCQFYNPQSGDILINNIPTTSCDPDSVRKNISAIFQDFSQFDLSLRENISISNLKDANNDKKIIQTLHRSGFDENISLETILGNKFENSINLSGGQWQKIALARAFFSDAPILILDEPTAALDARIEHYLFEKFLELTQEKTVFYITHRLSSVKQANKVLVLKDGKIHSFGTHEELIQQDEYYSELYSMQSSLYFENL